MGGYKWEEVGLRKKAFIEEVTLRNGNGMGKPRSLEGTEKHIRTIMAGEFDVVAKKHISRCYLSEYENEFEVLCDDLSVFNEVSNIEIREKIFNKMETEFNKSAVLWSLAECFFQLPHYFNTRFSINEELSRKKRMKMAGKKGGGGLNGNYVVIPSVEVGSSVPTLQITRITLPHYEIEREGGWDRLPKGQFGLDMHGNRVEGKNWISSASKWNKKESGETTIFLKETLRGAKTKIEDYMKYDEDRKNKIENEYCDDGEGEIYIMRCSAMSDRIYKVGYTGGMSCVRAKQLSSATGVPLDFIVEKKWKHKNARMLEKEVHMMLSPYQVNDKREFFMLDLERIIKIINLVIDRNNK